jgi:hypothetical protein
VVVGKTLGAYFTADAAQLLHFHIGPVVFLVFRTATTSFEGGLVRAIV